MNPEHRRRLRPLVFAIGLLVPGGCSIRRLAVGGIADALTSAGDVFATDDDPEFVRAALPFALKALEAVILEDPDNVGLHVAACRGFSQYAYAFVEGDADLIEDSDYDAALVLRDRALRMYLRARDYGVRALELRRPGTALLLSTDPTAAVAGFGQDDMAALLWTGLAWGAAISVGLDRPEVVADVDAVRALLQRCLELDPEYDFGAVQQAMMRIESLPEMMGGSPERAWAHFERAIELSDGLDVSPYVSYAASLCVATQDRATFEWMLDRALEIDPGAEPRLRLANRIEQHRARHLRSVADDLFLEPLE